MKTVDVYQLLRQLSGTINLRGGKVHFVSRLWGFQPTIDGPAVPGPVVRPSTTERVWWSNSRKEGAKGKRKRPGSLSCLNNQETSHEAQTSRVPNISPKHQPGDKAFNSWPFGGTSNRNIQSFTVKLKWPKFHFTCLQTAMPDFWKKKKNTLNYNKWFSFTNTHANDIRGLVRERDSFLTELSTSQI